MKRLLLLFLLLSLAALGVEPGDKVPDLEVKATDGHTVHLSELSKQSPSGLVCLVWWCSSCPSCRTIDASLDALSRRLGGQVEIACLMASAGETPMTQASFKREKDLRFPGYFDSASKLTDAFDVRFTTTTLIYDKNLKVRYFGRFREDQRLYADLALDSLLAGQPVATPTTAPSGCTIPRPHS